MAHEDIQMNVIENSGYNQYAVTNDLIIVYPQANGAFPMNLFNCWSVGAALV